MSRRLILLLAAAVSLVALAADSNPDRNARHAVRSSRPSSFAVAFQRGAAWSVRVYAFVPGDEDPRVGAGFLIDDKGSIATAAHVLDQAQQILVELPDRRLLAALVEGRDTTSDIALLRVDPPPPPRVRPAFARSGQLQVGDWVMATGEPFDLERSLSAGVVSGKDRHLIDDGELMFIQSDVALNPGSSRGPLLDTTGAVVGMNARTIVGPVGTPGASLAIPIDIVLQVVDELRRDSPAPARPRLGAHFDDVPPLAAWSAGRHETSGGLILAVPRGSLAERIKLRTGDIVTMMNGRNINGSSDLVVALLAWRKPADAHIVVQRAGQTLVLGLE